MEVAEEADRPSIGTRAHQHMNIIRLARFFRTDGRTVLAMSLEVTAIEHDILRIFAAKHCVRLGSRRHDDRTRGQPKLITAFRRDDQSLRHPEAVDLNL